tara:strand:+ start:68 stop:199 length:132 start_codon:yes stop_codon:yes gene_type:complete
LKLCILDIFTFLKSTSFCAGSAGGPYPLIDVGGQRGVCDVGEE